MEHVIESRALTHRGALAMLEAGIAKAEEIGRPQCIVIVDASGESLVELRMTGARFLSRRSARAKARTAASTGGPTAAVPEAMRPGLAIATGGEVTWLAGGLPIRIGGALVGGVGVGSGTGDEDVAVATAALAAIGAET